MKFIPIIIICLALLNLLSCTDRNSYNNEKSSKAVSTDVNSSNNYKSSEVQPFESHIDSTKQLTTHIIDVKCEGKFIPIRNRILTKHELKLSQKGTDIAKQLNNEVIIKKLYNGEWIKILKADTLGYHYIQVVDRVNSTELSEQSNIRGYIITKYCNKPTVRKFEKIHISEFDKPGDDVEGLIRFIGHHAPNGNLLDYAYTFVSQEADLIQTLSFTVTEKNKVHYELYQVILQRDAVMYEGTAELHTRYRKAESKFSKYITRNIRGADFEIHINESDNTASLKFVDKKTFFLIEEDLIMERIK